MCAQSPVPGGWGSAARPSPSAPISSGVKACRDSAQDLKAVVRQQPEHVAVAGKEGVRRAVPGRGAGFPGPTAGGRSLALHGRARIVPDAQLRDEVERFRPDELRVHERPGQPGQQQVAQRADPVGLRGHRGEHPVRCRRARAGRRASVPRGSCRADRPARPARAGPARVSTRGWPRPANPCSSPGRPPGYGCGRRPPRRTRVPTGSGPRPGGGPCSARTRSSR